MIAEKVAGTTKQREEYVPFIELCCRSYFSFLEGASSPEDFVEQAAAMQMPALGLVDRNGLYGALPFYRACKEAGIQPLIGAQLTIAGGDELIVLCRNQEGYTRLSLLLTDAYRGQEKGECHISWAALERLTGYVEVVLGPKEGLLPQAIERGEWAESKRLIERYIALFGRDHLHLAIAQHNQAGDLLRNQRLQRLSQDTGLPLLATNTPSYAIQKQGHLHDVLLCIKHRTTLNTSHHHRSGNFQRYLKNTDQIEELFPGYFQAVLHSQEVASRCKVSLDFSRYRLPAFDLPFKQSSSDYLRQLCQERLPDKYPSASQDVYQRMEHELNLIDTLNLSEYFLVVWDIVEYARRRDIPVQGRGSAANSIVTYILGITPVDPIANHLFLGRFLHEGMQEAPDIDLDFASTRREDLPDREDVIRYIYSRYGEDHVAMVCTFVTFQARSAIREVGRVLEVPELALERMTRLVGRYGMRHVFEELEDTPELDLDLASDSWKHFRQLTEQILHIPRHSSIHVGGMVIASRPIAELVPLEPARKEGRVVCQWDKDMVADAGLIKVDILGLGMLAVLRDARYLIQEATGEKVDLHALSLDDPRVYKDIQQADTVGVFQIESRAQMQSLPRTQPTSFEELGVQVAIIRPGPLQGKMVSPYIRRKQGEEPVSYMHPALRPILQDTLGVILFQEQVLQVAVELAGFSDAQAADLRRAMNRKRSVQAMQKVKGAFLRGARKKRVHPLDAEEVFRALEGFALYGFCKSHALSFAKITYQSAWLKAYHPAAFLAALLNNQPMGFYPVTSLIEDAKRHQVNVLPVDINHSQPRCYLTDVNTVQLGFNMVKGMKGATLQNILATRQAQGQFHSIRQFVTGTHIASKPAEYLIQSGALDSLGLERREMLWQLWLLHRNGVFSEDLFDQQEPTFPLLPSSDIWDQLKGEVATLGFTTSAHPVALLRNQLETEGVMTARRLQDLPAEDQLVTIAGLVTCRQRPPTAKGFAFLTVEDETGMMNVILSPKIYGQFRAIFRLSSFVKIMGVRTEVDSVVNVKAKTLTAMDETRF